MSLSTLKLNADRLKLEQIALPSHPLCREDVVWMLEFIKKKAAEKDPVLLDQPQPHLIEHFYTYAEVAMKLIHRQPLYDQDIEQLKSWIYSAFLRLPS
jgi:hypothetical protein